MQVQLRVPFLDLRVSDDEERAELLRAVETVLRHGRFVLGPEVQEFEQQVARFCRRSHAVAVGSGTDALFLGLKALGIGDGDEVITTPLSFIATANAISLNGAKPIFADIGDDLNIDPASIEGLITEHTRAILPVDYTGKVCRMDEIEQIARQRGLLVAEDASQAFGATANGRPAGAYGDLSCLSMNPMKVFAACGEAGVVLTDDAETYERVVALRYNGLVNRENCYYFSLNGRVDTIQAGMLLSRLPRVAATIARRREIAARYDRLLAQWVEVPRQDEGAEDCYYTYQIQTDRRDELKTFLEENGVECKIQHPLLMPEHAAYRDWARGHFPNAQRIVKRILCIPNNEKLTDEQVEYVAATVRAFFERAAR